jgi:hypothetical protein
MAVASDPDNTPLPGTVFTPRQVRRLKIAVIVMGILLVGGFALVIAALLYQTLPKGPRLGGGVQNQIETELGIPKDASVSALALDGDRLALHIEREPGSEIVVIDLASGKVVARVRLTPQ